MSAGKYESIKDVANRKIKIFGSRSTSTFYTTIDGTNYTLRNVTFPNGNSVKFLCDDLTPIFSRSNNGFSHSSFDMSENNNYFNTASVPSDNTPGKDVSDFWNNLKSSRSGGRRKKSRAKKSRKNRRTRRS
jgi:hypothetical protein